MSTKSNPFINKLVGEKIKKRRELCNLTQEELANKLHIPRTTLASIESGANQATINMLFIISEKLSCGMDNLIPLNSEIQASINGNSESKRKESISKVLKSKGIKMSAEQILKTLVS